MELAKQNETASLYDTTIITERYDNDPREVIVTGYCETDDTDYEDYNLSNIYQELYDETQSKNTTGIDKSEDDTIDVDHLVTVTGSKTDSGEISATKADEEVYDSLLYSFALRTLCRFGLKEKAYSFFTTMASSFAVLYSKEELQKVWEAAWRKYTQIIQEYNVYSQYVDIVKLLGVETVIPEDYSDLGEAKVVMRELKNEILYTSGTKWMHYTGKYWDESEESVRGAIENFLDVQKAEADENLNEVRSKLKAAGISEEVIQLGVSEIRKNLSNRDKYLANKYEQAVAFCKFVRKQRDSKSISSILRLTAPMALHKIEELDQEEYLLNTPEGTYDIRAGLKNKRAHSPKDYLTKMTSCSPGEEGRDLWLETVNRIFDHDVELIEYVQMSVGLAAIGKVFQEALIIAFGNGGNGKSTFFNAVYHVLGTYAGKLPSDVLTTNPRRNTMPAKAELKGKRLVIASETEEGMRLDTRQIKQLCSTDPIDAEKKYKDPFSFIPSHTLVLYTNHLPKIGSYDEGIKRRLIVVPFNVKMTGTGDVKNYADFLVENAGPYILTWILEGAKKAMDQGYNLIKPKVVEEAIQEYMEENDWFSHFLEECCDIADGCQEGSGDLYKVYRLYCEQIGEFIRSTAEFAKALEAKGYQKIKTNKGKFVMGLRLKEHERSKLKWYK